VSERLGRIRVPLIRSFDQYGLHPSLFDGALQIAGAAALGSGELRLPFNLDALAITGRFHTEMWIYVRGDTNADLLICDDEGRVAAKLSGYSTRPIPSGAPKKPILETGSRITKLVSTLESLPATEFGYDSTRAAIEKDQLKRLETLGAFTLLRAIQRRGILRSSDEQTESENISQRLDALPKYRGLCDLIVHFLKQEGLIIESGRYLSLSPFTGERVPQSDGLNIAWDDFQRSCPDFAAHAQILRNCVQSLPEVLLGQVPATDLLFPGGSTELVGRLYRGTLTTDYP